MIIFDFEPVITFEYELFLPLPQKVKAQLPDDTSSAAFLQNRVIRLHLQLRSPNNPKLTWPRRFFF